jgi:hypothetical protein
VAVEAGRLFALAQVRSAATFFAGLPAIVACVDWQADPTRSSYGREHWLRRCEGFVVETPTKRIGRVGGIRYGDTSNEPEVVEVRAGLFGRTPLLISVADISDIDPQQRRLALTELTAATSGLVATHNDPRLSPSGHLPGA